MTQNSNRSKTIRPPTKNSIAGFNGSIGTGSNLGYGSRSKNYSPNQVNNYGG